MGGLSDVVELELDLPDAAAAAFKAFSGDFVKIWILLELGGRGGGIIFTDFGMVNELQLALGLGRGGGAGGGEY